MGIDIYMLWDKMTEDEKKTQITGFSVKSGDVGYLREAYHGGPYATQLLVSEAFSDDADYDSGTPIDAALMRERLTGLVEPPAHCTGTDLMAQVFDILKQTFPGDQLEPAERPRPDDRRSMSVTEAVAIRNQRLYGHPPDSKDTREVLQSYVSFVELAERKQAETGKPVRIRASW